MIDPQVIAKANYNRTLVVVRVTAINSPDWADIAGTRIDLAWDANFANVFYTNSTTHYKVRAYIEDADLIPDRTVYARVTMTKDDDTTHTYDFNFVLPHPIIGTIKDDDGTRYVTSMRKMDASGDLTPRNYTNRAVVAPSVPCIDIMADATGEMTLTNKWRSAIFVENITQGTEPVSVEGYAPVTIAVNNGDIVRVTESTSNSTFRSWYNGSSGFCKGVSAHVVRMPSMDKFVEREDTIPQSFFNGFNNGGTITSFPEGSFDTHKFKYVETGSGGGSSSYVFQYFNQSGALTSLPEGSFDFSNLLGVSRLSTPQRVSGGFGHYSFCGFNQQGALTSLPEGSFDFDNLWFTGNGASVFDSFNTNGALTSIPEGSFGFSSLLSGNRLPTNFFAKFNNYGLMTTLPAGALHFGKGSTFLSNNNLFESFNANGMLTALPAHSLNFKLTGNLSGYEFQYFNQGGALTSLPAGSFDLSSITGCGQSSFQGFNQGGALTSLPAGSFNTENVTTLGDSVFSQFNANGALASLPEGSFNTGNMNIPSTTISRVFLGFNNGGALKTLPKGSFNFESLTTVGYRFCAEFNKNGAIEYLPIGAFSSNTITSSVQAGSLEQQAFSNFNNNGKLTKSDTDYNPNHIFPTPAQVAYIPAYYYNPTTQQQYTETVARGNPFKYYAADSFSVSYTESPAYTLIIDRNYLAGQSVTFTALAANPEVYAAIPSITADGGATIAVTDNGDNTFTFTMPQDNITVTVTVQPKPASITLAAEEAGQMKVKNVWTTPVVVQNITQEAAPITLRAGEKTFVTVDVDDEVTVTESSANVTFRGWDTNNEYFAVGVLCHITKMPPIQRFTTNATSGTLGNYAFSYFCAAENGKGITSLPAGSFNTDSLTNVGDGFASYFNYHGELTILPAGSFGTTNLTSVGNQFLSAFNSLGKLSRSTTDYNANFVNPTNADIQTDYWQGGSQYETKTITPGSPFYYKTT